MVCNKKKTKILEYIFVYFSLVVMAIVAFTTLYWKLHDYKILTPLEGNYELDRYVFTQGDDFDIHFRVCKTKPLVENIYGRFIDGIIFSVPENSSNFDVGCYDTYITSVKVPDNLPPGTYHYEETIEYQVNPLRTITYEFRTPDFEVVNAEDYN